MGSVPGKSSNRSAGLLPYRRGDHLEVFLVHPGGPFFTRKDDGAWTVAKGEYDGAEDPLDAAIREFGEETGFAATGPFLPLGEITQRGGKVVTAWAFAGEFDPSRLTSNTFTMEWPRGSGTVREFPEVDRGGWFTLSAAREKLLKSQQPFLDRLQIALLTP